MRDMPARPSMSLRPFGAVLLALLLRGLAGALSRLTHTLRRGGDHG
jgi:hypothetical protein